MDDFLIPDHLAASPFYNEALLNKTRLLENDAPFKEEILWEHGLVDDPPWEHPLLYVPAVIQKWDDQYEFLEACFQRRQTKSARPVMINRTASLMCALSWMNRHRVPGAEADAFNAGAAQMNRMPSNVGGRLSFIIQRPAHHHSFMQLRSLYVECRKQFALVKIEEKK
ncbi:YpoC family protein [Salibacterium sp. K-3]